MNRTRRKPLDTDYAKLTRTVDREFHEQCDDVDGHLLFRALGGRHYHVELYGSNKTALISVRRLAWALAHPEDHVGADEEVYITCEHKGNSDTGDGCCVRHLRKVKSVDAHLVRLHDQLSAELQEATV